MGAAVSKELPESGATTANPGASKAAISFHYDLGNEFFRLFLDRECCYSCAMYDKESDSFEAAQQRKLEYHIQQARADGAARVLDIGCGWGALQKKLVKEHQVKVAVGLTLSDNQAEWIRSMGLAGVEVRVESWSDHVPTAPYDSIISIGAFEHFARPCSRPVRVKGYRDFFERCYGWLNAGGWMSLQSIGLGAADRGIEGQFVAEHIFPESDLPRLGEIADAIRRNLRNRFGKKRSRRLQTYKPGIPRAVTTQLGCGGQPGRRGNGSPFRQIFSNLGGRLQPRHDESLSNYLSEACPSTFRYRFVSCDMHTERKRIAICSPVTARTIAVP